MDILKLKIIVVGMPSVGKTHLIKRFLKDKYNSSFKISVGIDIFTKYIEYELDKIALLSIWDIGGQLRFKKSRRTFYKGADGALVVFNPSRMRSFSEAKNYVEEIRQFVGEYIPFILVGNIINPSINKIYEVNKPIILQYAFNEDSMYIEIVPESDDNINLAFLELAKRIIKTSS
ncbi:MAG: GTP-binding protein [Candidatus Hermodarchaeota archaeon]